MLPPADRLSRERGIECWTCELGVELVGSPKQWPPAGIRPRRLRMRPPRWLPGRL